MFWDRMHVIGGGIGGAGGASAPPLFSEKAVNIINIYTFILGAEYFSPPTFCMLPPPLILAVVAPTAWVEVPL